MVEGCETNRASFAKHSNMFGRWLFAFRLISLIMALLMLFVPLVSYAADSDDDSFDLLIGEAEELSKKSDSAVTRKILVLDLYRAEGEPSVKSSITFSDVDSAADYTNAIIWAYENGIVNGLSETRFGPDDKITREQTISVLYRYAQYKDYDVTQGGMLIREFEDYEDISEYARRAMGWSVNTKLLIGKGENNLAPKEYLTGEELATILERFVEFNKLQGET